MIDGHIPKSIYPALVCLDGFQTNEDTILGDFEKGKGESERRWVRGMDIFKIQSMKFSMK